VGLADVEETRRKINNKLTMIVTYEEKVSSKKTAVLEAYKYLTIYGRHITAYAKH
jgi:hypothetical protein